MTWPPTNLFAGGVEWDIRAKARTAFFHIITNSSFRPERRSYRREVEKPAFPHALIWSMYLMQVSPLRYAPVEMTNFGDSCVTLVCYRNRPDRDSIQVLSQSKLLEGLLRIF